MQNDQSYNYGFSSILHIAWSLRDREPDYIYEIGAPTTPDLQWTLFI